MTLRQPEGEHDAAVEREGLAADPEVAAEHPAVLHQLRDDLGGDVDRDREADRLRAADDRGVDADHLAARVQQRPARVARVQRGVGLDHVGISRPVPSACCGPARDDAGRHGVLEAERIADRDRDLAARSAAEEPSASGDSEPRDMPSTHSTARSVSGRRRPSALRRCGRR